MKPSGIDDGCPEAGSSFGTYEVDVVEGGEGK